MEIVRISILTDNSAKSLSLASFAQSSLSAIGVQVESNATFDYLNWNDAALNIAVGTLSANGAAPSAIIMIGDNKVCTIFVCFRSHLLIIFIALISLCGVGKEYMAQHCLFYYIQGGYRSLCTGYFWL